MTDNEGKEDMNMKKAYVAPVVEVVKFDYSDQVVAASGCVQQYKQFGDEQHQDCISGYEPGYNRNN